MSAIKNGIKELHCKVFFFLKSGKRFKRSIAHNNLKLTCNIYHIQVFKLRPFLQIGLRGRHLDIRRRGGDFGGREVCLEGGGQRGWGISGWQDEVFLLFFFDGSCHCPNAN